MDQNEIKNILTVLRKEFPKAFPKDSFVILKKGIDRDILKKSSLNISRAKLKLFLKVYTCHFGYKKLHVVGATRYDLEGKITGEVISDDIASLAKIQKLKEQRKKVIEEQKKQNM